MQNPIDEEKTQPLFYGKEKYAPSEMSKTFMTRENGINTTSVIHWPQRNVFPLSTPDNIEAQETSSHLIHWNPPKKGSNYDTKSIK